MSPKENDILVETRKNGVTTLRMNRPKQLNGWTGPMMLAIKLAFKRLSTDSETKVTILTGSDPYYCAGLSNCYNPNRKSAEPFRQTFFAKILHVDKFHVNIKIE